MGHAQADPLDAAAAPAADYLRLDSGRVYFGTSKAAPLKPNRPLEPAHKAGFLLARFADRRPLRRPLFPNPALPSLALWASPAHVPPLPGNPSPNRARGGTPIPRSLVLNDSTHDRLISAADNAFAKWFTAYGLPVMLLALSALVGIVWNDLKEGQDVAARAQIAQAQAAQENAVQILQTRSDLTLLRAEITSGIVWRLQQVEERQRAMDRRLGNP